VFLGAEHSPDRRARAVWRTALWLALVAAFVPLAWLLAALLALVALLDRARRGRLRIAAQPLVPVLAALVLLLPWSLRTWSHAGLVSWLFEAGLPAPDLTAPLSRWDVLWGRPAPGAPGWLAAGVLLAALVALARPDTRRPVLRAWTVLVVALVVTVALAAVRSSLPAEPLDQPLWLGFPLVVAQGAAVCAAALAGTGIRRRLASSSFGWRQPIGVLAVVVAVLGPLLTGVWWVWQGSGGPLDRQAQAGVPTYMTDATRQDPRNGILVVRGSRGAGFDYVVLRRPAVTIGDDSVQPPASAQARLTTYVTDLVTAPEPADVAGLARSGVAYVYAPPPADIGLVGNLDSVSGVTNASATRPGARAWQLQARPGDAHLDRTGDPARPWLLAAQGLAVLVAAVLAAPSRREGR
jgi:hypothetical protein